MGSTLADIRQKTLPNGLRVIVRPDPSTPIVALNFWVRVGSNNETDDLMGWSHGIEHMLFKGTARRPTGAIAREIQDLGGETNAGTGYETTNYYIVVPREEWRAALDIHADVLMNSTFDPAELENERQVLIEENQMYRDRPAGFGKTWEELFRLGFTTHRYRNPIGGPDENLAETPRERILTHLHRYYVPGNIVYVVAGDVDPEEVFAAMAEVFADFPERPVAIDVSPAEPPQTAFRFRELPGDVNRVYGKLGFHIPGELHADADALAVFAHILGEGRSGRLYREVRERQSLVSSISVTSVNGFDPGLFIVDFQADADKAVDAVVAIMAEVGRFQREPVAPADLARTKQMVRSGYIFGLETAEGQASVLGHYATLGDLAAAAEYPERIAAVTAEQVMEVARRYFDLSQATLLLHAPRAATLVPDPARLEARLGVALRGVAGGAPDGPPPRVARPTRGAVFDVTRTRLPNGLTVLVESQRSLPIVAMAAYVRGGAAAEPAESAGLTHLAQSLLMKGAAGLDAEALAEALDGLGAHLHPFAGKDMIGATFSVTRDALAAALPLFRDVLRRPTFAVERLEREKAKALADLAALRDSSLQYTMLGFNEALYVDHPYGRPVLGREATIPTVTVAQLRDWHARAYAPERMVVAVVGDVDPAEGVALVEEAFGDLGAGGAWPDPPATDATPRARRVNLTRPVNQSVLVLGCPGPAQASPDRYALDVLMSILSGMGNRLFTELRDRRHLCYFTGAFGSSLRAGGAVGAYVGTRPENEAEALEALFAELTRAATTLPTAEEMERARNTIAGGYLIDLQRRGARAALLAQDEASGLGYEEALRYVERVRAVTPEEVRAVAARWFKLDACTIAVLRPAAADTPAAGHAAPAAGG